jgi:chondroitin 4-sulfotransferase 11
MKGKNSLPAWDLPDNICCDLNLLFVHIPKTAGVSIETVLGLRRCHATYAEIEQREGLSAIENLFKFCVVRNPWDKLLSHFFYNGHRFLEGPKTKNTFKEYVRIVTNNEAKLEHAYDQLSYITNTKGEVSLNYLVRFENLQEDFNLALKMAGIPPITLPHLNRSGVCGRNYRGFYTRESAELVRNKFANDIEVFNYEY